MTAKKTGDKAGPRCEAELIQSCLFFSEKYMNSWHGIMPLYSFRFLSAGRPKQRSNSVWEDSR